MCAPARPHGRHASPAARSRPSRPSPRWWPSASAPTSASATASRARATARSTCTRRAASRRCAAPGRWKAAARSTTTARSITGTRPSPRGSTWSTRRCGCSISRASGRFSTGEADALIKDIPVTALLIQNTNPVSVAPEQDKVKAGFAREDLFVCVHEQFMTETARMADVVLPATMFMEHDDIYQGGGHQYIQLGLKLIDPPGECRNNHEVHVALAQRLGARHEGFDDDAARAHRPAAVGLRLGPARRPRGAELDRLPAGFRHRALHQGLRLAGRKFRFKPDWTTVPFRSPSLMGPVQRHAGAARPLGGDRGGDGGASVPARRRRRRGISSTRPSTRRRPRSRARSARP